MADRFPGEVYYLPPEDRDGGDPKTRPHVLLSVCREGCTTATMAFCSSQSTEAAMGADHVLVNPARSSYRGTGFTDATYVYPSRLVCSHPDEVLESSSAGRIIDELPDIRSKLAEALGIGTGVVASSQATAGSLRGRIVQLTAVMARDWGCEHALVVASHSYSREQRYLNAVPLVDGVEYAEGEGDIAVEGGWTREMGWEAGLLHQRLLARSFILPMSLVPRPS